MVLDSASPKSRNRSKGKGGDDLPFFFMVSLNELTDGAVAGQTDMDQTLLNLE
jgi:hypothetical protein